MPAHPLHDDSLPKEEPASPAPAEPVERRADRMRFEEVIEPAEADLGEFLDLTFTSNPFQVLKRRIVLATRGSRVGSHFLIDQLLDHGIEIEEYFSKNRVRANCKSWKISSLEKYCRVILERKTNDGHFGVKGPPELLAPLSLAGELPANIHAWKFIYLSRSDLVRQAISIVKAKETGAWNSMTRPSTILKDADYDADDIRAKIRHITQQDKKWQNAFDALGVEPLRIAYEDLVGDPTGVASRIAKFAGLQGPPLERNRPLFAVQSNELSDRWSQRFREENRRFCEKLSGLLAT